MIIAFRKLNDTWFFKGILVLAILSFVSLWGVGGVSLLFSDANKVAVEMDGREITNEQVLKEFEWELNNYRSFMPMGFSYSDAIAAGVFEESLYNSIYRGVMAEIAEKNEIIIPDSLVFEYIKLDPQFADEGGQFKRTVFLDVLSKSKIPEQEFIQIARSDIVESYILDSNRAFPIAPKTMLDLTVEQRTSLRDAIVINIKSNAMKLKEKASDDELQGFYEENKNLFTAPEYRDFPVASITYEQIMDKIDVSEDELELIFEEEKEALHTPETRQLWGMVFEDKDKKKADEAVADLKAGKDFKNVAMNKRFIFEEHEWNWGYIAEQYLVEELREPVFKGKVGDIIGPIKSVASDRTYVVLIKDVKAGKKATFKDKRDMLLKRIKKERSEDEVYALTEAIEEDMAVNTSVEEIAKKHGLKFVEYKNIPSNNKKIDRDVLETAFLLQDEEFSGVVESNDGFFITKVTNIVEPKLKPFNTVKKQVTEIFNTNQKQDIATALANEVIKLSSEKGIKQAAKDKNLATSSIRNLALKSDKENTKLSEKDIEKLFLLNKGEAFVNPVADGYVIVGLGGIAKSNTKITVAKESEIKNDVEDSIIKSLEQQFYMDYASELNVQTDEKVIGDTVKKLENLTVE